MLLALKSEDEAAERELAQFTICIAPPSDAKLLLRAMKLRGFERPTGRAASSPGRTHGISHCISASLCGSISLSPAVKGTQDVKIYSHAHSLSLSLAVYSCV